MNLFVDTSVWSLALRRSPPSEAPEVSLLTSCLQRGDLVVTTGLVLQELLQGFQGPQAKERILRNFSLLPVLAPEVDDHVEAAQLRNLCRRRGVQIGTIDALIARLCIRHELSLLTADRDFELMSRHCPLSLLTP
ncbi:MAG: PIN domain-containing protein [Acidobacteriota bacterium]